MLKAWTIDPLQEQDNTYLLRATRDRLKSIWNKSIIIWQTNYLFDLLYGWLLSFWIVVVAADFISLIGIGASSFAATNIDDLFILMAFFANRCRFPISQVVLGQYVGMGSLLAVGIVGSLIALVVPNNLIGLIGIFPIAIGIKELLELRKKDHDDDEEEPAATTAIKQSSQTKWIVAYLPFLTVAAVTFSGGEEVGIYTSVFAINNKTSEIIVIISVVMGLTGVWCGVASYLVNHSFIADRFRRIASRILPFVLIGLGLYIMAEAFLL